MRVSIRLAAWLLLVVVLSACTYRVRESNIVIARVGPPADVAALATMSPEARIAAAPILTADGATLHSVQLLRDDAVATVLYFGGNGYTLAKFAPDTLRTYAGAPVNVVLVDHRGYGGSTGTASLAALLSDALQVHDAVQNDAAFGGLPVIVHGHSLGSFMAGHVAQHRTLDGLILESSVTTTEDWMAHLRSQQALWARLLVRRVAPDRALAGQGNAAVVGTLDEPVLFVVGADDDVSPPRFSQALFDATPLPANRKRLLVVPDRGHMNAAASPAFADALLAFVGEVVDPVSAGLE